MQVYRGMDIGTAKPTAATRARIPHHMVDVVDPSQEYDVVAFQADGRGAIQDITRRDGRILIVGGSGLHFRAMVDPMTFAPTDAEVRAELETIPIGDLVAELLDLDPGADTVVDVHNPRRVIRAVEVARLTGEGPLVRANQAEAAAFRAYEPLIAHYSIGIDAADRAHERADVRFDAMVDAGLVEEVTRLAGRLGRTAAQAVGYKELLPAVQGDRPLAESIDDAKRATHALIKRQRTYFRRDPRIVWMAWQDDDQQRIESVVRHIERVMAWSS